MSILSIAGVDLPVSVNSFKLSLEDVGQSARNTRGHRVLERRRSKWVFDFELSPAPLDEVMLYRSLILGDGEFWSMASGAYGSKGLQITGTGAWTGTGGFNPILGGGTFRCTLGQTMVVPGRLYDQTPVGGYYYQGASLAGWRYDEFTGVWRLFGWSWRGNDATVTNKREKLGALGSSGAAQAYTGTETFSVSSGTLTATQSGGTGGWRFSNLMLIPWFLPDAQLDQLLDGLATITLLHPPLPRLYVQSDMLPVEQLKGAPAGSARSVIVCHGSVSGLDVVPLMRGGSFQTTDSVLSATLTEV